MSANVTQIRKIANKVLGEAHIAAPPVDVEAVARLLGVRVVYEELDDDMSGLLLITQKRPTIAVNAAHHENRQRFTIAHELGHLLLHATTDDDLFVDKKVFNRNTKASQGVYRQEIEANRFAAELLMPKKMIESIVLSDDDDIDLSDDLIVSQLARSFRVSEQALAIRLASLDLVPTI